MRVPIDNLGRVGIVSDPAPHILPPEVWTAGNNVRFHDNKVARARGSRQALGTPPVAPYFTMGVPYGTGYTILYAGQNKIYAVVADTEVHTNLTRQSVGVDVNYNMDTELLWNGGIFGGIPILNNGIDVPQFWAAPNVGTKMADLTNWPSTHRARVIRPWREFLIALNLTVSGVNRPHRVLWSHPADPGSLPISWDVADPTKDAGEYDLTDSEDGVILDGLALGNQFIIYKENSSHRLTKIGGQFVMDIKPIAGMGGILHTQCVRTVPTQGKNPFGGMHFVATADDVVLFDGNKPNSLLSERQRVSLNASIDDTNFNRSFVVANRLAHEMWFAYPEAGATWPTRIVVWNYDDNTISFKEIDDISYAGQVLVGEPTGMSDIWNDDSGFWNTDSATWDSVTPFSSRKLNVLACDPVNTKLMLLDDTDQFDGMDFTSYIERQGLAIIGRDRLGNATVDFSVRKVINRIWPKAKGDPFYVRVGVQETVDSEITWWPQKLFRPAIDQYVDLGDGNSKLPNGRLIAVRFESSTDGYWELNGYDLDMSLLGAY